MTDRIIKLIQTIVVAYFVTAVLLLVLAMIAFKTGMKETIVTTGIYCIYILSTAVSGFVIGRKIKSRRVLWGMAAGFAYYAVIFLVSLILNKGIAMDVTGILMAFALCVSGGFAGSFFSLPDKK